MENTSPASPKERIAKLRKNISGRIDQLSHHKFHYRGKVVYLSIAIGCLASFNAFLVGVSQIYTEIKILGVLAFFMSSAVAVVGVVESVIRPKEMWIKNAEALNELYDLRERISFKIETQGSLSHEEINEFWEQSRSIEKSFFGGIISTFAEQAEKKE